MSIKNMTCIVCPVGCRMEVEISDDGKITNVEGNACKRGEVYARDEITAPKRVLTTTVRAEIGGKTFLVPVKTKAPIPKELLFKAMDLINKVCISSPKKRGEPVIENILSTGVDVVLTDNFEG